MRAVRRRAGVVAQIATDAARLLSFICDKEEKIAVPHPQLEAI
jgi:hypothetical protein